MADLKARATAFIRGPCCHRRGDGPIFEMIRRYALGESWKDPGLQDSLSEAIASAQTNSAERHGERPSADARLFYQGAAEILKEIQAELSKSQV